MARAGYVALFIHVFNCENLKQLLIALINLISISACVHCLLYGQTLHFSRLLILLQNIPVDSLINHHSHIIIIPSSNEIFNN